MFVQILHKNRFRFASQFLLVDAALHREYAVIAMHNRSERLLSPRVLSNQLLDFHLARLHQHWHLQLLYMHKGDRNFLNLSFAVLGRQNCVR